MLEDDALLCLALPCLVILTQSLFGGKMKKAAKSQTSLCLLIIFVLRECAQVHVRVSVWGRKAVCVYARVGVCERERETLFSSPASH